jgi:hypothetical protein
MIERVTDEISALERFRAAAAVTGSFVSLPVTNRVLHIPLAWVVQSTWLPDFFERSAA